MAGLTRDEVAASGPCFLHDDFEYRDNAGFVIAGRDANVAFLEEKLFGMMPDWRVRALHVLSAGDWAVAWTKSQGTYAGGIPGVDADSQAVTMHRLEIAQLRDGKLALHRGYGNGLEAMAQLGLVGGAGGDKPEPEDVEQEAGLDEAEVELDAALEHVEGQLEALAEELDVELEVLQEEVAAELEGIEAELQAVDVDLDDEAEGD
jgi:predicted ester cyclase